MTKINADSSKFHKHDIKRHVNLQKLRHKKPIKVKKEICRKAKTGDKTLNALKFEI